MHIFKMNARHLLFCRYLLLLVIALVLIIAILPNILKFIEHIPSIIESESVSRCYESTDKRANGISYFDDILDSENRPLSGKAIFFHETSCSTNGIAKLNAKQACAIESAARWNPNRDVFVIFASPVGIKDNTHLPPFIKELVQYDNIHFRNMNLWRYSMGTPAEEWAKTNELFETNFLYEHMSDYLRAATLYKFGGLFMDLDVVVQKCIDGLGEDFLGDDWSDVINGAVMHLNNYGVGHKISGGYLENLIENFDGVDFIKNGPKLLTHIFADICKTENRTLWTRQRCDGLKLQPKEMFYPVSWTDYMMYFQPNKTAETLELAQNSTLIHVWNDRSKNIWNKIGTNNAYQVTAEKNCPFVYKSAELF